MARCPHCQTDLGANPAARSCAQCGKPLPSVPSTVWRPAVGQLTKAGIVLTLLWVVLVNFLEHCKGVRMQERLIRDNSGVRPGETLQPSEKGSQEEKQ